MSQDTCQTNRAANRDMLPVTHSDTPPFLPRIHATNFGLIKCLIGIMVIFMPSCVGLRLFSRELSDSPYTLQASRSVETNLFGPNSGVPREMVQENQVSAIEATRTLAARGVTLARREDKGAKYTFNIPIESKQYQFLSKGSIALSTFKVMPVKTDQKFVTVKVYVTNDQKNAARAYTLPAGRKGPANGVAFTAPNLAGRPKANWPVFNVIVSIPISGDKPEQVGSLETKLPQFHHEFVDLAKSFVFSRIFVSTSDAHLNLGSITTSSFQAYNRNGRIKLGSILAKGARASTTNGHLTFDSIAATNVQLRNSNGQIYGKTFSWKQLTVTNLNSKITGEFTLMPGSIAKLTNKNAAITGQIKLKAKANDKPMAVPNYRIEASTTTKPLDIKVLEQPIGSGCYLTALGTSAVQVHVPPAFEGTFRFKTVQTQPKIEVTGKNDPAGRGRERFIQYTNPKSKAVGRTGWGKADDKEKHAAGAIAISSTRGPAQLFFD